MNFHGSGCGRAATHCLPCQSGFPDELHFIPSRIPVSRVRYVLLFIRGGVQVEACPCGQEYAFARNLNAGVIGIFESESDAELQLTFIKFSRMQTETRTTTNLNASTEDRDAC